MLSRNKFRLFHFSIKWDRSIKVRRQLSGLAEPGESTGNSLLLSCLEEFSFVVEWVGIFHLSHLKRKKVWDLRCCSFIIVLRHWVFMYLLIRSNLVAGCQTLTQLRWFLWFYWHDSCKHGQVQEVVLLDEEEVEPKQPILGDAPDDWWFTFSKKN